MTDQERFEDKIFYSPDGECQDIYIELSRLREREKELVEALRSVLKLIDDGVLVRDISKDHESGWAIKQLPLIQTLGKAKSLLSKFEV